jgi:hypothetical protein
VTSQAQLLPGTPDLLIKLTSAARRRLREEADGWNRLASAIASALAAQPEKI